MHIISGTKWITRYNRLILLEIGTKWSNVYIYIYIYIYILVLDRLFTFITAVKCKKKWKNLKDDFQKHDKSGAAGTTIQEKAQRWRYFDQLSFLCNYLGPRE